MYGAFLFIAAYCLFHVIWSYFYVEVLFFVKGNIIPYFKNILQNYVILDKFGDEECLALDGASAETIKKRKEGLAYLKKQSNLKPSENIEQKHRLGDPRFDNLNNVMPVLTELNQPNCNVVVDLSVNKCKVKLPNGEEQPYCGNNAVHYFEKSFYDDIHQETFEKLSSKNKESTNNLKYVTTTITPEILKHSKTITEMTNLDLVRYATSGSEAVDCAIKQARRTTSKDIIIRFDKAYHGHTTGITLGSPHMVYLKEMDESSLDFIEEYHYRIAGVIVNPMQHFTGPNKMSPPGEKLTFGKREQRGIQKEEYAKWLHALQLKCNYCSKFLTPVAFMLDDVYFAFRTKELFSFRYFQVDNVELKPDIIILGKGIAAGFPLSVVVGNTKFMGWADKKKGYMLKVNTTVGTFSGWHGGIVASNIFLDKISKMDNGTFDTINDKFKTFATKLNAAFNEKKYPLCIRNFANVFTMNFKNNSFYNSFYSQYLMNEGIFLSNQTVGKFNLQADCDEKTLKEIHMKFLSAAEKMEKHGFFVPIKESPWKKVAQKIVVNFFKDRYNQIMEDKRIDIEVSHNHPTNRWGHFWSSIGMILYSYPCMYMGYWQAGFLSFLITHMVRQAGHFFYERQDLDFEKQKFGHKDPSKKFAAAMVILCIVCFIYKDFIPYLSTVSDDAYVVSCGLMTTFPHYVEITHKYGAIRGVDWLIKILTDPFTDVPDFYKYAIIHPKNFLDLRSRSEKYDFNIEKKML